MDLDTYKFKIHQTTLNIAFYQLAMFKDILK